MNSSMDKDSDRKEIADTFVDAAIRNLGRNDRMKSVETVPEPMIDPTDVRSIDSVAWQTVSSTVTDADLDELEVALGLQYPTLYRDLLQLVHFMELSVLGINFFQHDIVTWRLTLENAYRHAWKPQRIVGVGLIPFAVGGPYDVGPVCFDTREMVDGDCRVVYWDHKRVGTEQEVSMVFSSFERMLLSMTFAANQAIDFVHHDEDDDPNSLPVKRELLKQFLALDADGAGGPGLRYWTSFGVSVAE